MGKLAKPQRSKKHKKLKAVDPFYHGSRKDSRTEGLNKKPKNYDQEVPKKLKQLGFTIDGVRHGKVGKNSVYKFRHHPDAPQKYKNKFSTPLGLKSDSNFVNNNLKKQKDATEKPKESKKIKIGKVKISEEAVNKYIDNITPSRPFVENFQFTKNPNETDAKFMKRVNEKTNWVLSKSKIDDMFDISDEKKIMMKIRTTKGMSEKKKQRLKEKKKKKLEALKEKKEEKKTGFAALQDKVEFGEVVHAPPVLSVRPKKAVVTDVDRPGLRMPELKAAFEGKKEETEKLIKSPNSTAKLERQVGKSIKRKSLSLRQKAVADAQREKMIEHYRQLKKIK
ncbi:unnamed protein product [Lymnaea stagnalis]|uniref:Uncharacterized protein n=1 Tax=Lymnaea stagnalis TaxID=6523 RepID=A0AAV2HBM2_LYMST